MLDVGSALFRWLFKCRYSDIIAARQPNDTPFFIPHSVLVKDGELVDWVYTQKSDAVIKRKFKVHVNSSSVYQRLCLRTSMERQHGVSCVFWPAEGEPKFMDEADLGIFLSDCTEASGACTGQGPTGVLQRYVTSGLDYEENHLVTWSREGGLFVESRVAKSYMWSEKIHKRRRCDPFGGYEDDHMSCDVSKSKLRRLRGAASSIIRFLREVVFTQQFTGPRRVNLEKISLLMKFDDQGHVVLLRCTDMGVSQFSGLLSMAPESKIPVAASGESRVPADYKNNSVSPQSHHSEVSPYRGSHQQTSPSPLVEEANRSDTLPELQNGKDPKGTLSPQSQSYASPGKLSESTSSPTPSTGHSLFGAARTLLPASASAAMNGASPQAKAHVTEALRRMQRTASYGPQNFVERFSKRTSSRNIQALMEKEREEEQMRAEKQLREEREAQRRAMNAQRGGAVLHAARKDSKLRAAIVDKLMQGVFPSPPPPPPPRNVLLPSDIIEKIRSGATPSPDLTAHLPSKPSPLVESPRARNTRKKLVGAKKEQGAAHGLTGGKAKAAAPHRQPKRSRATPTSQSQNHVSSKQGKPIRRKPTGKNGSVTPSARQDNVQQAKVEESKADDSSSQLPSSSQLVNDSGDGCNSSDPLSDQQHGVHSQSVEGVSEGTVQEETSSSSVAVKSRRKDREQQLSLEEQQALALREMVYATPPQKTVSPQTATACKAYSISMPKHYTSKAKPVATRHKPKEGSPPPARGVVPTTVMKGSHGSLTNVDNRLQKFFA